MWALLVLTLALVVRASEKNNDTAVGEQLGIARGKLLVSTNGSVYSMDNITISSGYFVMSIKCALFCDIGAGTGTL